MLDEKSGLFVEKSVWHLNGNYFNKCQLNNNGWFHLRNFGLQELRLIDNGTQITRDWRDWIEQDSLDGPLTDWPSPQSVIQLDASMDRE